MLDDDGNYTGVLLNDFDTTTPVGQTIGSIEFKSRLFDFDFKLGEDLVKTWHGGVLCQRHDG